MTFEEFKEKFQKKEVQEISFAPQTKPLVSVLVQTYNHEKYLCECLESILHQETTFSFEIILGEDGSTDGTKEICIRYAENYPEKIRLFLHHRENQIEILGEATSNFNAFYNFFSARGDYYAFCEGDDLWTDPLKLQKHIDTMKRNTGVVFTYHSYLTIDYKGEFVPQPHVDLQPTGKIDNNSLMEGNLHPLFSTVCFKKVFLRIPLQMAEVLNVDTFLLSLLGNYGSAEYLGDIRPSQYRIHDGGIWSQRKKEKKFLSKILTFEKLEEYYYEKGKKNLEQVYKRKKENILKMAAYFHFKNYKFYRSFSYISKYFKSKFFSEPRNT